MTLASGSRLGTYEVLELIGVGAMGEVYRARDTRLGREVALKVLPEQFSLDEHKRARFEHEARMLASLNHPNIATLHGIEESTGRQALVLELVEGETLAERLARRRGHGLPVAEALGIAEQIALALEAAHEHAVIHRDLKPHNISLRPDGTIKLLDFGIAKALAHAGGVAVPGALTVATIAAPGGVFGTPAYMSPEQAQGLAVDKRADIWAFGCVLYEMLTGRQAFDAHDPGAIATLERSPDLDALPAETPVVVRRVLRRCLERDPRRRLRDIGDAYLELSSRAAEHDTPSRVPGTSGGSRRTRTARNALTAAALAVVVIAGVLAWRAFEQPGSEPASRSATARFAVPAPELALVAPSWLAKLSPDGGTLVYVGEDEGTRRLYRREMNELEARAIPGTERAAMPFFSPDGQWLGFFADDQLKKVALAGGDPVVVAAWEGIVAGATWTEDDTIVWGGPPPISLMTVSADGGAPEPLLELDADGGESNHWIPQMLPGGNAVLLGIGRLRGDEEVPRVVAVHSFRTGQRQVLFPGTNAQYLATGHIVYLRPTSDTLWVVPFDAERLEVTGDHMPVLSGVRVNVANIAHYSVADDGTLAYVPGTIQSRQGRLVWMDRSGRATMAADRLEGFPRSPRVSPDGARVAAELYPPGEPDRADIWVFDVAGSGRPLRLTRGGEYRFPLWSPDGTQIAVASRFALLALRADGTREPERIVDLQPVGADPYAWGILRSWQPDGQALVMTRTAETTGLDLLRLSLGGDPEIQPLITAPFNEDEAAISPDAEWIAYVADLTGRPEVYVQRYRQGGAPVRVSDGGGHEPVWARDGSELYYQNGDRLMAVAVTRTSSSTRFESPETLFQGGFQPYSGELFYSTTYDVAPDRRFIMIGIEEAEPSIVIVQRWIDDIARLTPGRR